MPTTTCRSFLQASAAMLAGAAAMDQTRGQDGIAGLDQTRTDDDRTQVWKPFSDRKIRMGLVKKIYAAGGFGKIIYSEGEYCHTRKPGARRGCLQSDGPGRYLQPPGFHRTRQ